MPKPKRSICEQIERYKRKLQDLEKAKVKNKRRRRLSSDESDDNEQGENHLQNLNPFTMEEVADDPESITELDDHGEAPPEPSVQPIPENLDPPPEPPAAASALPPAATPAAPAAPAAPADPTAPAAPAASTPDQAEPLAQPALTAADQPPLDPALLEALGESSSDTPEYGTSIHDNLANIWLPLLKKGMLKDTKDKLLKEYLIPNNCKLLQAPKLNAEISAAVSEIVRGRDKKYAAVQQQLGQGIAAVSRAMDVLLKTENKVEALKYLSDGCRILSDTHHFLTKDRIKLIIPSLEKKFLHVIQDTERDESLFGSTLSEKIKASKAIERQGKQIKKTSSAPKPGTSNTTNTRASTSQGNWSGPPRYSSNRGGRRANHKANPLPATRRPYINTPASTRPPAQNKPRASHQ